MEKTLSVEEKIKKAEEIYNRRLEKRTNYKSHYSKKNEEKVKYGIIKRMSVQIVCSIVIYTIFYVISNNQSLFSEDFRNNINIILNEQIDFNKIYKEGSNWIERMFSTFNEENVENTNDNKEIEKDIGGAEQELVENNEEKKESQENNEDLSNETSQNIEEKKDETIELQEKSQMQIDADEIKKTIEFEIPVEGHVSSKFGPRNPTSITVPKNHTGLDIAAPSGTVIKSATDGKVILASTYGDYGKHYKIEIGDIILVYAHCSKLYLKEGDSVTKGQSIAEVGSTGNSTGPHLHFEIRREGRFIDPQLILDF